MWVLNIMNDMQSNITNVKEEFEGNWLSIFIRLGPKGKRQMLITTETRRVRFMHRFVVRMC